MKHLLKLGLRLAPKTAVAIADWVVYTIADTVFLWQTIGELQEEAETYEAEHRPAYPMPPREYSADHLEREREIDGAWRPCESCPDFRQCGTGCLGADLSDAA